MIARATIDRLHQLRSEIKHLSAEEELIATSLKNTMERDGVTFIEGYRATARLDWRVLDTINVPKFIAACGGVPAAEPALSVMVTKARTLLGADRLTLLVAHQQLIPLVRTSAVGEAVSR